jgi:DNA repair protein RecN (Recombination protein N)
VLLELRVKNFGIIEEITWRLSRGLNVLTGETGAGKSLVVDAVEALVTGRADEKDIRHGASEARIEAVFSLHGGISHRLTKILSEHGLSADEESLVIDAQFRRAARGTVRVNGKAVTRGLLQHIGSLMVDIHGQSEHLSLLNKDSHLSFLDAHAHTTDLREQFGSRAAQLSQLEHEIKVLVETEMESARRAEFLRFQIGEIQHAELKPGEDDELQKARQIIASSEKLKSAACEAYNALYGDDSSMPQASGLGKLNEAVRELQQIVELDETMQPQRDFLRDTITGLEETARDIRIYGDGIEYDPQRLEEIESRIELIRNLKSKYGQTIAEVLDYLGKAESELGGISHSQERRLRLEEQRDGIMKKMGNIAAELTGSRQRAARELESTVQNELKDLNMAQVEFEVHIARRQSPDGLLLPDGNCYEFNRAGVDLVEFMASTNPGEPRKPLNWIASTGEMSRFMLALKSALAEADSIPVIIFDEIDIGIGGRSGEMVGRKLWALARERQTICITHLPQIAAFADALHSVRKQATGGRTTSTVETLEGDDQINEITSMFAGPGHSEVATRNARELLAKADAWKQDYRATLREASGPESA